MEEIVLVGFGGHAKSIADAIECQSRYKIVGYTDIEEKGTKYKYLGNDDVLDELFCSGVKNAVIALGYLGTGDLREKLCKRLKKIGYALPVIIDPSAIISKTAIIGEGTFIGKGAIINCEVIIGKCCIINTGAIIEHETKIDDFSHVSVGTVLCGQVKIGNATFLGANSTVIQSLEIFDREIVPAGAVIRKKNVVFGSVIYKAAVDYVDDFINSINEQTNDQFDILLINDDICDRTTLEKIKKRIKSRRVIIKDYTECHYSPARLRLELLRQAKLMGYKLIILGDCDDTFSENRVNNITNAYCNNGEVTFFYNDLLYDGSSVFTKLPSSIENINDLIQYNFIGMSTSAINLDLIDFEFIESLHEFDGFVFDWYLYSRLALEKKKGIFVSDTFTKYRIHGNNYAGLTNDEREMLEKEIDVKKKHYLSLAKYDPRYEVLLKKISDVDLNQFTVNKIYKFWWSNIIF